ncbi:MAG TPA: HEPN domain-containing protein [Anaerolineae bacterium]
MIELPALESTELHQSTLDNLPAAIATALLHFRDNLLARFPGQILRLILYGSFARGEAHAESDVDVMVVTTWEEKRFPDGRYASHYGDPRWGEILDLASDATLECGRAVSAYAIGEKHFKRDSDVAIEARREGFDLLKATFDGTRLKVNQADTLIKEPPGEYAAAEPDELDRPHLWLLLADEKLPVARDLLKATHYDDVVSKAYYAMFYACKAALLAAGVKVKTHNGAASELSRVFVATGRIDQRYSAMLSRALQDRIRSDYEPNPRATKDEAENIVSDAEAFIAKARELVEEELSQDSRALP